MVGVDNGNGNDGDGGSTTEGQHRYTVQVDIGAAGSTK